MKIADSPVLFTVQAADPMIIPEALFALKEGDCLSPSDLEPIVPGLADMPSSFGPATAAHPLHTLTTLTDGILVVLELAQEAERDCARAEAKLRGTLARFIVTMLWPPGSEIDAAQHALANRPFA
ncbi:hypothetical protein AWB82_01725 [Caballeronia glebae]|uniref:Uncharacterized protein n=1 Tax=Caballeronia glebae TaxID=1777143 RepID=A0A158A4K7_9BURK|nr:hypothetical protein [Caballeronia glebae]SAK52784.1 hypothetical protein AWB82_01725 [Caballeronia glebae]